MIFDIIIIVGLSVLNLFGLLFQALSLAIPQNIEDSIAYFAGYINYFRGFFPIDQLINVIIFYILFLTYFYTVKIILWGVGHIPWLGKHEPLPKVGEHKK